ncbi:MAG: hypothetical protein CMP91_04445 [Gammaproteobacteria bacterium]|nr:hypothetical protein [Gammaproteobacteria bacterium]MAY01931.1 hypothetical protein [Gammaproteobacteria bacterium]|tara:strand:- start:196480 stop:197664 length:1185 start_codon:yes stop_codon:yes gene_type:complete
MTRQRLIFATFLLVCLAGLWFLRAQLTQERPQVTRLEARPELLDDAEPVIELSAAEDDQPEALEPTERPATTLERMEMEVAAISEAPPADFSCNQAPVREVTESTGPRIYQWRDENGRLHFGDSPPPGIVTTEFDARQATTLDYFQLQVEFRGGSSVPYFRGQIQAQANSMYEILADLLGEDRLKQVELNVIVFSDNSSYREYANSVGGAALANAGGFYSNASNEAVTFLYDSEEQTLEVSRHEAAHVILNGLLATGPLWLHEGMAEYFEQLSIQQQLTRIAPNDDWLILARNAVETGYMSNLQDFLDATPEQWRSGEEAMNYALGWSLVYFMLSNNDGRRALTALLQQTADAYCTAISSVPPLSQAYPGGLTELQEDFFAWLMDDSLKRSHNY